MLGYLLGQPLEIDAAAGLFPVAEPGRLGTVPSPDLPGRLLHGRLRSRLDSLRWIRPGLLFLRCIHGFNPEVCQIRHAFTTLKIKTNLCIRAIRHPGWTQCDARHCPRTIQPLRIRAEPP